MANINIENGRERITINGDPDKVIELNLSDSSIVARLEKAKIEIDEFFNKIKDIADNEDQKNSDIISDTETKIREKVDYIFDYPVSAIIFGNASCISTKYGVTFFERAINALMPLYEKAIKAEQKKSAERTKKYTDKYKEIKAIDMYELPKSLEIDGVFYNIRCDFRAVLDIIAALNDTELTDYEKAAVTIQILYKDCEKITDIQEAFKKAMWFINCGEEEKSQSNVKLMDWEQDFKIIVAPINRVLGYECRSCEYLHWWTFVSAYYEIGECTFSNVVNIRSKRRKGKKLEKWEEEFYRENRDMIDLKQKVTSEEQKIINDIMGIL